ncbi:hypothetical protein PM3016_6767 [Paenibacillus mucilaginosus 3016]|uniref:Uncharacterized protein n=1 Tax=Paenibacillus mucilaginosus 3016 TaxID=1116391 RepID=H6NNQ2_9BACL|nr:hypothetical protein PM3016_6767 [Paenibacillus mucilaginosus 3016]
MTLQIPLTLLTFMLTVKLDQLFFKHWLPGPAWHWVIPGLFIFILSYMLELTGLPKKKLPAPLCILLTLGTMVLGSTAL